jgi:hypothetical protein
MRGILMAAMLAFGVAMGVQTSFAARSGSTRRARGVAKYADAVGLDVFLWKGSRMVGRGRWKAGMGPDALQATRS